MIYISIKPLEVSFLRQLESAQRQRAEQREAGMTSKNRKQSQQTEFSRYLLLLTRIL